MSWLAAYFIANLSIYLAWLVADYRPPAPTWVEFALQAGVYWLLYFVALS